VCLRRDIIRTTYTFIQRCKCLYTLYVTYVSASANQRTQT